ncbi:hypothetical protein [Syntrophothermus lipocalidus]|uniref:Uncharacterized protein n=1 Tax=Syntrophothermus lipocalidus (strain DSM 12680 / TGB-C1) TaxID=643648 RepID=D7CIP2_SYNLT|nr:hypothetical protein [Syntrophothermus lipocalidus]ADI00907.1 hypothetical protein Slip_0107 [Syntrophothermus lipocalidus DSM 12680]
MKVYYVCECCDKVYAELEIEGEGYTQVSGLCAECLEEIGGGSDLFSISSQWFYN